MRKASGILEAAPEWSVNTIQRGLNCGNSDQVYGLMSQWGHMTALLGSGGKIEAGQIKGNMWELEVPLPSVSCPSGTEARHFPTGPCSVMFYPKA